MSDIKISREVLLDGSDKWADLPTKASSKKEISTRIEAIRVLEVAIRTMIQKGYTYKDVTEKLFEDFQIEITPQTLSSYLATIKKEHKKTLLLSKREAVRLAKISPSEITQVESNIDGVDGLDDDSITSAAKLASENISANLTVGRSTDKTKSKSIVPKVASAEDGEAVDENEAERLREEKMDKFYNKY
jgi:hypothetical protein